jgi:hypothetical protein
MPKEQLNKIDEEFASIIHDVWSRWQNYLHGEMRCIHKTNEYITFSFETYKYDRWERQLTTSYSLLPENEKQSDRNIFEEYYKNFFHSKLQEAIEGEREKIIKVIEIFMQNSTCCYDNPCIEEIINKIKSLQTNKE